MKPRLRAFLLPDTVMSFLWGARSLTVQLSLLYRLPPFFVNHMLYSLRSPWPSGCCGALYLPVP